MSKRSKKDSLHHGLVLVDKPAGMTSQDVVSAVRRLAATRRVGHTGTLDPMATGLLVILLGEAAKLSEYLVGFDKTYEGTMRLGATSDTYDLQGEVEEHADAKAPDLEALRKLTAPFTGEILQTPPPYSAVKVRGRKLYEYARAGETVEVEPRPIRVDEFEILEADGRSARFRVACSSGTYVRSLVHELGQSAGCGAVVESLRRTRVGDISIDEAATLQELETAGAGKFGEYVLPMVDALTDWPIYAIGDTAAMWVKRGQAIPTSLAKLDPESRPAAIGDGVFLCPFGGDALAVAKVVPAPPSRPPAELNRHTGMWFQPVKLLTPVEEPEKKD